MLSLVAKANHIIVFGEASKKVFKELPYSENDLGRDLMAYLRGHGVPIASSCLGEGFCQRCLVNTDILSCQTSVRDFIELIPERICRVTYL